MKRAPTDAPALASPSLRTHAGAPLGTRIGAVLRQPWLWAYLLGLGIGSLLWNVIALALYPILSEATGCRIGRAAIAYGYRFYWFTTGLGRLVAVDASALDSLADEPGGLVVAANHPSMVDALAIVSRLPRGFCIMKASLMRNPFLAAGARLARYASNDSPRDMLQMAVNGVRDGGQLVLFPEGTRTIGDGLNRFLPGVSTIAHRANVPIQTVIIDAESPYLSKGWPIWKASPLPMRFRLRLGRRFEPSADYQGQLAQLEAYFRHELGA
jgi:1-acyl-sn-glycerol-3-phosphate acyltransferase